MRKKVGRVEALLHPARLRVFREIAGRRRTAGEIAAALPDVAQATLYRHLALMVEAGLVNVVEERRVRGAVEKTYAAESDGGAALTADDLADASGDDHFRSFAAFVAGLLGEYAAYLRRDRIDLLADGVGYRERCLNLDDEEFAAFAADLGSLLARWERSPGPDRTPRLLATVLMPLDRDPVETSPAPDGETP